MPKQYSRFIVAVAALSAFANQLVAQAVTQGASTITQLTKAVTGRSRIRVRLTSGAVVELRQPSIEGTTLVGQVATADSVTRYRVEELDQIWSRGSAAGRGLAIGAGVGAVGGAIGGVALSHLCVLSCNQPSAGEELTGAAFGALLGGLTGGAVGLLFGAPFGQWNTAYQTHRQRVKPIVSTQRLGVSVRF
jgi:hypothetical protein